MFSLHAREPTFTELCWLSCSYSRQTSGSQHLEGTRFLNESERGTCVHAPPHAVTPRHHNAAATYDLYALQSNYAACKFLATPRSKAHRAIMRACCTAPLFLCISPHSAQLPRVQNRAAQCMHACGCALFAARSSPASCMRADARYGTNAAGGRRRTKASLPSNYGYMYALPCRQWTFNTV